MKARVKATGEIIEVMYSHTAKDTEYDIIWYCTPRGACFSKQELEFIDTGESLDYWTRLEHTYAGMAMQGMLSGKWVEMMYAAVGNDGQYRDLLTNKAKEFAHALVQKMKEERK